MKLGEMLSLARELKGWTLRDLEKKCSVSNALPGPRTCEIGTPHRQRDYVGDRALEHIFVTQVAVLVGLANSSLNH